MYRRRNSPNLTTVNQTPKTQSSLSSIFAIALIISVAFLCVNIIVMSLVAVGAGFYAAYKNSAPPAVAFSIPTPIPSNTQVETPIPVFTATPTSTIFVANSDTPQPEATQTAVPTIIAQNTATSTATATTTALATSTNVPLSTETRTPTFAPTATSNSTQQAGPMAGIVQQLFDADVINSTNGIYSRLPDYESNWAQTDSYQKTYTGFSPTNFILRADATWQVYENTGNWTDSGCGIVFHEDDGENHYLVVFSMGGQGLLYRRVSGSVGRIGISYRYEVDHDIAQAKIMLAVEDNWITIFVNDRALYHFNHPNMETGKLAFTVISGSTIDFGTRCSLSNIELWEIQ